VKKVALYLIHPNFETQSRINKALIDGVKKLENVTVYDMYKSYPDYIVDVEKEQSILTQNDVILFQFPLYWFSSPSLLKKWTDSVFTTDFAYGKNHILKDKILAIATTAGGEAKIYQESGVTVEDYLVPFQGVAGFTKMDYKKPFVVHNTDMISDEELKNITQNYIKYIQELSK